MARIRSLKPELWTSRTVSCLSFGARLSFIGLWSYVDDSGRGVDDARLIKAAVWPLDDEVTHEEVERHLEEIEKLGLIIRYDSPKHPLLQIRSWEEHQRISKPAPSKYPGPPENPPGRPKTPEATQGNPGLARALEQGAGSREQGAGKDLSSAHADGLVRHSFDLFWETYPKQPNGSKPDRKKAWERWQRLSGPQRQRALIGVEHYAKACNEGTWAKHAFRWLADATFEDWQQPVRSRGPQNIHAAGLRAAMDAGVFDDEPLERSSLRGLPS